MYWADWSLPLVHCGRGGDVLGWSVGFGNQRLPKPTFFSFYESMNGNAHSLSDGEG